MKKKIPYQYQQADKSIKLLNKRAIRRFNETKSKLSLLKFDELTVIKHVKTLYEQLDSDNKEVFLDLAKMVYKRVINELEDRREEKEITEFWLLDFLDSSSPVTKYVYENEVTRKREYTTEAINASKDKALELSKALVRWSRMTAQYADLVADEATLKAFNDAGVKKVMWRIEDDDKVCKYCRPLDKQVFPIDKVPPKQHWRCRCWLEPVISME